MSDKDEDVVMSSGDDEHLYGNVEDLKLMIGDDEDNMNEDDNLLFSDSSDEGDVDALLQEFSDLGEVSDDDDEEDFMDAIREANNFKTKKKKKSKGKKSEKTKKGPKPRRERVIDPEVAQLISEANEAFVRNDLVVAERLFNEIIKKDPRNFAAYETLGDIYQIQGRLNDCCNSWFIAAHLNSSDWEFWRVVAALSADLGHARQAIYCYSRVINIHHDDTEAVYRRAVLYKDIGQIGRALEGFQKLYVHNPYDPNILRELAVLYVEYNRINEAIDLYTKIFQQNVKRRKAIIAASESALESSDEESSNQDYEEEEEIGNEEDEERGEYFDEELLEDKLLYPDINWKKIKRKYKCINFDWSALNILTELFLKSSSSGLSGIKLIKKCARWIQRRELQTFWDDVTDDSEFDSRRLNNGRFDALSDAEKSKSYSLPIDIRIRLGLLRLGNDQLLEAMNHFQFLYDEDFVEITDLYFEVAVALAKAEKYKESIDFFRPLMMLPEYQNNEMYRPLCKCFKEVEEYELAKEYYLKLITQDPTDIDDILNLAEVYYQLGEREEFHKWFLEAVELRKRQDEEILSIAKQVSQKKDETNKTNEDVSSKPLLEDSMFRQSNFKKKKTPQDAERERVERERKITTKVTDMYNKQIQIRQKIETGDEKQVTSWIDIVSDLIDIFSSVKNFFIKSRSKKFVGIIRRARKFNRIIDYKIERLSKLSEGENLLDGFPFMEERVILTSTTELRGLSYDQWFELFMDLALTISKYQSIEDGLSVIDTAQEVNVFFQDPDRVKMMRFVKLAIVLKTEDEEELTENLRGLLNQFQFNRKVLQVFMYSLARNQTSFEILTSTVQQKFFLRQLKAFDSCRYNTHVNGQASITNKVVENPEKKSSPYLYYIYAILLYSSRGFLSALQYLNWLEKDIPNDPMMNLLSGLSHLHRSMQRLTANRHFQILHGLRYLYKYYDIRMKNYSDLEKQEADYNIGRAFHLLGLVSIAVQYYHKVLEAYDDDKLKKHAAYNCIIIYQESGNNKLADHLMKKYLNI
ncbi:hypothetical protein Kpol_2000p60 [Vanderwaltozyma polyspora DSM 70294]|uniref:Transcription factor tau 131 kDa subunit n=1 Tax=Vanderwaltozyma polyspora (strain ATCC 22028 / DSM 70294 / BCRC 21397 / CBS 2163 / NBRC 10782 / NRRL Y-8283 / UCD 57-17) TaxID=436907 RepID=A7TF68_VANPO|nr:uncharacterized protein Kpol_2000p60 [Vanderwaltozyma polyspora DSM 70294]EDO19093.1 hypothetical protein Kpol_2000p60 [Vanderwaltozyma polyspora DSM 70294]